MNEILTRTFRLKFSDFNCHDDITPYAILDLFQDVAGEHASYIGVGFDEMVKKGYYWVLLRTKFEIVAPIKEYSNVVVSTWPKARGRFDFDREYKLQDENGNLLAKGISKWCIIDIKSRRISPCKDVNYTCSIYPENNYPDSIKKIEDFDITGFDCFIGKTSYIDLDHNGHVNNIAYARYMANALKLEENEKIKSFEIDYVNELKANEEFILYYHKENKKVQVKGFNKKDNLLSFTSIIELQ